MSKIRIRNFGPIKEGCKENDGWLDIKKVTVFIGNQGSGKSTVAKLISTFAWMEKALTRGDYDKKAFERKDALENFFAYHKIDNYFYYPKSQNSSLNLYDNTEIEYVGNSYTIKYHQRRLKIQESRIDNYSLPQIMYVPADRNFISAVDDLKSQRLFSASLVEFLAEYQKAKKEINNILELPINKADLEYDNLRDILYVKGKDYKIKLSEASSGFQSLVPLYLVSMFLAKSVKGESDNIKDPMSSDELERFKEGVATIWGDKTLTEDQRRAALSVLSTKFNKTAFINIVEEPEQNLFPTSQWEMLQSLLEFNNMNTENKLIITTHSPYIINFLSIAIQGEELKSKIEHSPKAKELLPKLNKIVNEKALTSKDAVIVYQLDETDGSIKKLSAAYGIPSDKNYLNSMLREGNQRFDSLLELEQEL